MDLADKVVIVTGGASGIGAATARSLAAAGAIVVVSDVDEPGGRAVADQVGGSFVACDVADLDANLALVAAAVDRYGGVDAAFLNAGVASGCGFGDDFDLALYRRAMGANLDGVVFGLHAVLPALRARGGGAVVATASLAGLVGMPMDPLYGANKHAVVGLVRAAGPALVGERIRVNAVCPGFAKSALTAPLEGGLRAAGFDLMPAEKVADAVVDLMVSDAAGECWVIQPGREPLPFAFRNIPGPRPQE